MARSTATSLAHPVQLEAHGTHRPAQARECSACTHPHALRTTCRQCPECPRDLTPDPRETFVDLLPGGADAQAALTRHNGSLRLHAACDGACGVPGCGVPYFDEAGLTCHRRPRAATSSAADVGVQPNDMKEVRDAMTTPPSQDTDRPVFGQPDAAVLGERR
jgi:hypothetical protein